MGNEGSATIESSLVFPLTIFFVVMIISISIFVYKNVSEKMRFTNEVEKMSESIESVSSENEIVLENKMLFKNTWDALTDKATETINLVKKKIERISIIEKINDIDFASEKASNILKGKTVWMKMDLSHLI